MIAGPNTGRTVGTRSVVVALGGNALLPPGRRGDIHEQFAFARTSLAPIVALARDGWQIAIVHGNGPQIGDELLRNELAHEELPPLPLGVLVAATAGWIGYMIQQSLENALEREGIDRRVVTLITQVLVDPEDPATTEPTKPIGRVFTDRGKAEALARRLGWTIAPADGGWRRLVPSPRPLAIVEGSLVRRLLDAGTIVIAAGGGGTPVYRDPVLRLEGVDAVIDKDRAAQVLALDIGAEALLILTNVDGVYRKWGTPQQELLRSISAAEAEAMLRAGEFGRGSMGPKVEAAIAFVRGGGGRAYIGRLDQGLETIRGETGTLIAP
ncbi:MAG: carbamate kinase [Gemmatimonadetes bacterium]|nr:carbamate kinase [Gemmatimonadota bacterium]